MFNRDDFLHIIKFRSSAPASNLKIGSSTPLVCGYIEIAGSYHDAIILKTQQGQLQKVWYMTDDGLFYPCDATFEYEAKFCDHHALQSILSKTLSLDGGKWHQAVSQFTDVSDFKFMPIYGGGWSITQISSGTQVSHNAITNCLNDVVATVYDGLINMKVNIREIRDFNAIASIAKSNSKIDDVIDELYGTKKSSKGMTSSEVDAWMSRLPKRELNLDRG